MCKGSASLQCFAQPIARPLLFLITSRAKSTVEALKGCAWEARSHPWFKGLWGPVPMCKGALACSASPSHALALCTAFKGSCPLASSAAIADASVQPACMQMTDPSAMVSSGVCVHCVAAMLLGQICCCDPVSRVQKKYRRTIYRY